MGLEQIKGVKVTILEKEVEVFGIDKESNKKYALHLKREDYDAWQNGVPLSWCAPYLSLGEVSFLNTGVWNE
jgi:hypothetical protein